MYNQEKTGNRFVDQLDFYQAANSSNEAIKSNFIIRLAEFNLIIENLKNKKVNDPLQHELVLGRRGSGKSTLLKRIQIEIDEDPVLAEKYVAINTAEEQASIFRLFDLWLEVLRELQIKLGTSLVLRSYYEFNSDQDYTRYLHEQIHTLLKGKNKKAVLLLDNLDRIVGNFSDDGHLLRETLLNFNDVQIIGGSTRMDEHFWKYDKPFYEFFRRHRLEGLSLEEIRKLLDHWSNIMDLPELAEFAKNNPGKIEAVRILTDGLPRTLQFFIQVLLQDANLYAFEYIRRVMGDVTPLYQERLNYLPAAQRKIVLEMAFFWEACSAKQLAEKCNMASKLISAHLKQLSDNGIVETITTSKKNHLYRLSERFFNMWLIVTQGNPDQKRKAKWLTIFLETWYDAKQLKSLALNHIKRLKAKTLSYDRSLIMTKALCQSKYTTTTDRDEMLEHTLRLSAHVPNKVLELPKKYKEIIDEINKLEEAGQFKKAFELTDEIDNEEDGMKFYIRAQLLIDTGDEKEAEKQYLLAASKNNVDAVYDLAFHYYQQKNFQKAEKYFKKAAKLGDNDAYYSLGVIYQDENKLEEAEQALIQAIKLKISGALNTLANVYVQQQKKEKAEQFYLQAIEEGDPDAMFNFARLCEENKKFELAEHYYLMAISKGRKVALNNLGAMYMDFVLQDNPIQFMANGYDSPTLLRKAEKCYLEAIKENIENAIYNLAILYDHEDKQEEAAKYYSLASKDGDMEALFLLAELYYRHNVNKAGALDAISKHNAQTRNADGIELEVIIRIWNGHFEGIEKKVEEAVLFNNYDNLGWFIENLLVQDQTQIVLKLFTPPIQGTILKEKYSLLYYATQLLSGNEDENIKLRIPPEVMQTVSDICENVRKKRAFYNSPM